MSTDRPREDSLGLSLDMLDVDRLRALADRIEEAIRDIGKLRQSPAVAPTISTVLPAEASDQAIAQAVRATPQGQVVAVAPPPTSNGLSVLGHLERIRALAQQLDERDNQTAQAIHAHAEEIAFLHLWALRAVSPPQEPTGR